MALFEQLSKLAPEEMARAVFSRPRAEIIYRKCTVQPMMTRGVRIFQLARYTEKQAFHENIPADRLWKRLCEVFAEEFSQLELSMTDADFSFRETKKGNLLQNRRAATNQAQAAEHNRKKKYILPEGEVVPALVDLGVITSDGRVCAPMYDKYKQINRFLELVADVLPPDAGKPLRAVDFGCGKSYLTFVLYHYLTRIRGFQTDMLGLDLKADVVAECARIARKYGYDRLRFETGDVAQYAEPGELDLLVTLHACDTATDYALYAGVRRSVRTILSVPCCQHELNKQFRAQDLDALGEFGILQERFSALSTDALRGLLLEAAGYRTQILEFIDMEHSPKNLLIRAVRGGVSPQKRTAALQKAERLMKAFHFCPTLYTLFQEDGLLPPSSLQQQV